MRAAAAPSPWTVLVALFLTLLLGGVLAPAPAGAEERTFAEQNFKLTTPNDNWQWMDLDDATQQAGYVARLGRRKEGTVAVVAIRVVPTNNLSLKELTQEVRDGLSSQMTPEGSKVAEGRLSGLVGTEVIVKGKNREGAPVFVRAWAIESGGKFHQMIATMVDGAEVKLAGELDKLRRGYRLLTGAGPEEPDMEDAGVPEVGGGTAAGDDWPEKGPTREGRTIVFSHHNLRWTLPEGCPLGVAQVTDDEAAMPDDGGKVLIVFRAAQDREAKQEGEPTRNAVEVLLSVQKPEPGAQADAFATNSGVQDNIAQNVFDTIEAGYTKTDTGIEIGNYKGARLRLAGKKDNDIVYALFYWVVLKERLYIFQIEMRGGREADNVFKDAVLGLMDGLAFPDIAEWVAGPIGVPEVPPFNQPRGHSQGEAKEGTSVGFTWEKPAEMAALTWDAQGGGGNLRVAWELRSEDKQSYIYFDVMTFPFDVNQKDPEQQYLDQRETLWRQGAESAQTVTKGKKNSWADKWGKGKGLGYEFKGYLQGVEFKERGYVVRLKKYIYFVRIQLGGKDPEKVFASTLKSLKKAIEF